MKRFKHYGYYFELLTKRDFFDKRCPFLQIDRVISGVPVSATAYLYWNFHEPVREGRGGGACWERQPTNEYLLMELSIKGTYSLEVTSAFVNGLSRIGMETDFKRLAELLGEQQTVKLYQ